MIYIVLIIQEILELLIMLSIYAYIICIGYFTCEKFSLYYNRWKTKRRNRQIKKEYEIRELYRKERERYPLFYWRETCRKDSDQRETCKQKEKK